MITFALALAVSHSVARCESSPTHAITISHLFILSQSLTYLHSYDLTLSFHPHTTSLTSLLLSLSRYCSNSIFTLKLILSFSRTIPFD